jgi:tripeptide aminopeptidase
MESLKKYNSTVVERFLSYVTIDTQSDPSSPTVPSTAKQKDLGRLLVQELHEMGIADAELDAYGYVYATIPATGDKEVPVICFCSHMDTSPDCSGKDVRPLIHRNYQGEDLVLPADTLQVIRMSEHPDLRQQFGNDIITASGDTLLGADNKAGVAEIMDAAHFFMTHPEVEHGRIRILFTPDEEIGRGVDKADLTKLGAHFGYTVDGETLGSIENETFSADGATLLVNGVSSHPGFAKGAMESALKIASRIVAELPADTLSPETTPGREGFIHPVGISGSVEQARIDFILRDFDERQLEHQREVLRAIATRVIAAYPASSFHLEVTPQYRNMRSVLEEYPMVTALAEKAMRRAGLEPRIGSIRGGTDGSRLSFMGLPCPNIFAGEHAFHGRQEWVSAADMRKAVETIVNIGVICYEEG